MHIGELLEELRFDVLRDVSDIEVDDPQSTAGYEEVQRTLLWPDDTLVRFINRGYFRLAEEGYLLRDHSTPETCRVELVAGQEEYALHPKVLAVYSAELDRRPLARSSYTALTGSGSTMSAAVYAPLPERVGTPLYFTTDQANDTLRVYPAPDASSDAHEVVLRVARLPMHRLRLPPLGEEDPDYMVPEIPEQYHADILDWAAYLALRNHDVDGESMNRARSHRNAFERRVEQAKQRHKMELFQPPRFSFRARW